MGFLTRACSDRSARCARGGEAGTDGSSQALAARGQLEKSLILPQQAIEPAPYIYIYIAAAVDHGADH